MRSQQIAGAGKVSVPILLIVTRLVCRRIPNPPRMRSMERRSCKVGVTRTTIRDTDRTEQIVPRRMRLDLEKTGKVGVQMLRHTLVTQESKADGRAAEMGRNIFFFSLSTQAFRAQFQVCAWRDGRRGSCRRRPNNHKGREESDFPG